jgi:hypothetical protein
MQTRYRLVVAGPLPQLTEARIRDRFGEITVSSTRGGTVIDGVALDQAALRALLTLLWDGGGEVLEVEPSTDRDGDV